MNDLRCVICAVALLVAGCADPKSPRPPIDPSRAFDKAFAKGELLYQDAFDMDLSQWVVEQRPGGEAMLKDGRLDIDDAGGCTVWFKRRLTEPVLIEYEAILVKAGGPNDRVSDLNCFWMAIDPEHPEDLFADRERGGRFSNYHDLRLYYVGYGANNNTTTRFRRYLGDGSRPLLPENDLRDGRYMHTPNRARKIQIATAGNAVQFLCDGEVVFDFIDAEPYREGWLGFRTVRNHMRIDNFRVYRLVKRGSPGEQDAPDVE